MSNPEMQREFLEAGGEKPKRDRKPRKAMKQVSEKQKPKLETWALIKKSMMLAQYLTWGHTYCMECKARDPVPLDLDHIKGRAWTPENAQLLCRPCHEHKTGTLQWTKGNA